jgi:hypothetical protein
MWRALQGATDRDDDGDEVVQDETGTSNGSGVIVLEWTPIRPGTLTGTVSSTSIADDGNGNILNAATMAPLVRLYTKAPALVPSPSPRSTSAATRSRTRSTRKATWPFRTTR